MNKSTVYIAIMLVLLMGTLACSESKDTSIKQVNRPRVKESKAMVPIHGSGTKIVAHRGFSGVAPENTLASFRKAIEVKADYFELDVHKTKDGQLVVIHDSKVDRTSSNNTVGKVSDMTLAELAKVQVGFSEKYGDAFANEKVPTLKEVLQLAKGKIKVCIEVKESNNVEQQILDLLTELKMKKEVIIFSFHYPVLTKFRQLDPTIEMLYLIDYADKHTIDYATLLQVKAVGVGYATNPSKEFIEYAHSKGVEVWKWTINKETQMKEMIEIGLDGMITNFPDKALDLRDSTR